MVLCNIRVDCPIMVIVSNLDLMKKLKLFITTVMTLVGIGTAYSDNNRITYTYTNQANNSTYTKVDQMNIARCITSSTKPCFYVCSLDLGMTSTETTLVASGCTASPAKGLYVP